VRIAREALPFAAGWAGIALAVALWAPVVSMVPLGFLAFTLYFFRDPERVPPSQEGIVVSPADGRIVQARPTRVSVFLNLTDVHVCRAPQSGRVQGVEHVRGRFLAAFREAASEHNERTAITVETGRGPLALTLVAGLIARRIVCKVVQGQQVAVGERVGLIRFGSRVDLHLPPEARVEVRVGDRVRAGETVIARFAPEEPAARG